jgi:hypothetical protein
MPFAFIRFLRGGRPDNSLPGGGEAPDNSLPGGEDGGYPDQGLPGTGRPVPPIALPPLPGIWPKPGVPVQPLPVPPQIAFPEHPSHPIYIEPEPENPIVVPPGEVYPPLAPELSGKYVAILVIGEGGWKIHWYHVPPPSTNPPQPMPK